MNLVQLGAFFKTKRTEQKLTQSQVANHLGISPQAVSKWERGENLPDVSFFPDIAALYQTSIDAIVTAGQVSVGGSSPPVQLDTAVKAPAPRQFTPAMLSQLFDSDLFEPVLALAQTSETVADMDMSFEFFAYLSKTQKHMLLDVLLTKPDYVLAIEDMIPTATAADRFRILDKLLLEQDFDTIQEIVTFLSPRHRQQVSDFIVSHDIALHVIEPLLPFFDHQQTTSIHNHYQTQEVNS